MPNQQGRIFSVYLIVIAVGVLCFLLISSTSPSPNQQISKLYPKTPVNASQTSTINVTRTSVSPNPLTIQVGDTVTWVGSDAANHMIMSNNGTFGSPVLAQNQTYSYTFTTPGSYPYYCMFHPSVTGTIIVQNPSTPTPAPTVTPIPTSNSTATPNPTSTSTSSPTSTPIGSGNGLYLTIPSSMMLAPDTPTPKPTQSPKLTLTPSPTSSPAPTVSSTPTPTPKPVKKSFFQPVLDFFQSAFSNLMNIFHR